MTGRFTLNAVSSSFKFGLYEDAANPVLLVHGQVNRIGCSPRLVPTAGDTKSSDPVDAQTQRDALDRVMKALAPHMRGPQDHGSRTSRCTWRARLGSARCAHAQDRGGPLRLQPAAPTAPAA